jgi:undecaprenyl-diphosphatase
MNMRFPRINNLMKAYFFLAFSFLISAVLFRFDPFLSASAQSMISGQLENIFDFISDAGLRLFYLIFAGLLIFALIKKNRHVRDLFLVYLKAELVFSFVVVRTLKFLFGRARPAYGSEFTFFSFNSHFNAFPSGHSADAAVAAAVLFFLLKDSPYKKWRFVPAVPAILVAGARFLCGAHHLSDVIAGCAIGVFGGFFFLSGLRERSAKAGDDLFPDSGRSPFFLILAGPELIF